MSYLVLARKYRPQTFSEIVGQEHVSKTLSNAILSDRVAHAILFAGPRGTGKTTIARILAKSLNCKEGPTPTPCNICNSCQEITAGNSQDVFEIDGASNNSVEQIRELRENIKYMPATSRLKIYIIDEVHMLSTAAFNALLKTLEEPPAHVKFMFATTEPHKIPITILSRCQRHDLRRISLSAITTHMDFLCKQENTEMDSSILEMIAMEADGSMRDGLSLLDQIISCTDQTFTQQQILDILGVIDRKLLFEMSSAIIQGDIHLIIDALDDIYSRGHNLKRFYTDLIEHFRNLLIVKMGHKINKLVDLPEHEIKVMREQTVNTSEIYFSRLLDILFKEEYSIKISQQPKIAIEMVFIKLFQVKSVLSMGLLIEKIDLLRKELHNNETSYKSPPVNYTQDKNKEPLSLKQKLPEDQQYQSNPVTPKKQETSNLQKNITTNKQINDTAQPRTPIVKQTLNEQTWKTFLDTLAHDQPSLSAILLKSTLKKITNQSIELNVSGSAYEISRIQKPEKMNALKQICNDFFNQEIEIIIHNNAKKKVEKKTQEDSMLNLKQEIRRHPIVVDAIEIFDANQIDIKIL
ncbi:MAG: hypothetical protein B6I31_04870 [Desulfobacteraceae bacterium 4572_19]|nr:MAG: hypothetical protein B6I31_04870 [Desulfobacteraceae bacterium 4572_19]